MDYNKEYINIFILIKPLTIKENVM